MLNLHQLRLFCSVAEKRSISLAARDGFMTPSALSIQIKRFEASLGLRLLDRGPGGLSLTPAGSLLYDLGVKLLREEQVTLALAEQLRGGSAAGFRIGATPAGAMYFLTAWLKERPCPQWRIQLDIDAVEALLVRMDWGVLDLIVDFGPHRWQKQKRFRPLFAEEFVLLAAPRSRLVRETVLAVEEFPRLPFIAVQLDPGTRSFVENALALARLRPNVYMRVPSIDAAKRCVEADLGVTFAPRLSTWSELRQERLIELSLPGFALSRELGLLTPGQPRTARDVSELVAELESYAAAWESKRQAPGTAR